MTGKTSYLKVLYAKKEKKHLPYFPKHNSKHEKQVILLMIPNREEWHYISAKKFISIIKRNNIKK